MPWEKQFDVDDALTKAMHAFWARGYEATSMRDLVDRMGINRGSLYATFGGKRSLFIQALRHYDTRHREAWLSAREASDPPREAIIAAFDGAIEAVLTDENHDGCLLVNTALELSPHDSEIAGIVAEGLRETEAFFRRNVAAGQAMGTVRADKTAEALGAALLGLFLGLRVLARSRPEERLLRAVASQAADLLGEI